MCDKYGYNSSEYPRKRKQKKSGSYLTQRKGMDVHHRHERSAQNENTKNIWVKRTSLEHVNDENINNCGVSETKN